jgi:hypothetical protein
MSRSTSSDTWLWSAWSRCTAAARSLDDPDSSAALSSASASSASLSSAFEPPESLAAADPLAADDPFDNDDDDDDDDEPLAAPGFPALEVAPGLPDFWAAPLRLWGFFYSSHSFIGG